MAGALLLLASTVTGVGSALQTQPAQQAVAASLLAEREAETGRQSAESVQQAPIKKNGRFKVNLFRFRR
jgi:hypothetical protein